MEENNHLLEKECFNC